MAISNEEVEALLEKAPPHKDDAGAVRPYDFTAQRINRTELPLLDVINKNLADRAAVSLSGLLGRTATMHFDSMESVKTADLQVSLPVPACLAVVRLKPLNGFAYISVEPALLLTLLDGFFGGTGRPNTDTQAATAPAAQRFQALMVRSFAADVTAAWAPAAALELELVEQETNPRLLQLGNPQDPVIVAKFTVEFAARSGRIDWLLPEALLSPVRGALSGETEAAPTRKQEPWGPALTNALKDAQLDTRAVLAQAQISLRELVTLNPGDIIPIEAPQHVTLLAGEVPLYQGRFGISQGRNALKIVSGVPV